MIALAVHKQPVGYQENNFSLKVIAYLFDVNSKLKSFKKYWKIFWNEFLTVDRNILEEQYIVIKRWNLTTKCIKISFDTAT